MVCIVNSLGLDMAHCISSAVDNAGPSHQGQADRRGSFIGRTCMEDLKKTRYDIASERVCCSWRILDENGKVGSLIQVSLEEVRNLGRRRSGKNQFIPTRNTVISYSTVASHENSSIFLQKCTVLIG